MELAKVEAGENFKSQLWQPIFNGNYGHYAYAACTERRQLAREKWQ